MSDKPREWPNMAKAARDDCADDVVKAIRILESLVMDTKGITKMSLTEILWRVACVLNLLQRIARRLESMGAPTRVNEL